MDSLVAFCAAIAGASGALVGLLFVAASVSRDDMVGEHATARNRARSSLALTSFVTPLVVSLFALVPGISIRVPILVAGVAGILFAVASVRRIASSRDSGHGWRQLAFLLGFGAVSLIETAVGIGLLIDPHWSDGPTIAAAMLVVLIGIGIDRAWELIGGRASSFMGSIATVVRGDKEPPRPDDHTS